MAKPARPVVQSSDALDAFVSDLFACQLLFVTATIAS